MTTKRFYGAMLATTVALSALVGCTTPSPATPGTQPGAAATGQAGNKQAAGTTNGTELAAAMSEEREADGYGYLAAEASAKYELKLVGAPPPPEGMVGITAVGDAEATAAGEGKPAKGNKGEKGGKGQGAMKSGLRANIRADIKAKLDARKTKMEARLAKQVAKLGKAKDKIKDALAKADWKENEDGTKTKNLAFDVEKTVNGKAATRNCKVDRTVDAEGELVKMSWNFAHTSPTGAKNSMTRTKDLQEDGSYKIVYHSEIVLGNGASRIRDWTKIIPADGVVSGGGTIVWKDKDGKIVKTVDIKFGGTDEAEVATCVDTTTSTTTQVTVPADGAMTAEVKETSSTTTTTTEAVTITETTEGTVEVSEAA